MFKIIFYIIKIVLNNNYYNFTIKLPYILLLIYYIIKNFLFLSN